jgi:hypothetical protein
MVLTPPTRVLVTCITHKARRLAATGLASKRAKGVEPSTFTLASSPNPKSNPRTPKNLVTAAKPSTARRTRYGVPGNTKDVTDHVRAKVVGDALPPRKTLPDPAFGQPKTLVLEGTYGGREFVLTCRRSSRRAASTSARRRRPSRNE